MSILIFHRVMPKPDPLFPGEVDAAHFDHVCGWIRQWFNVLPLAEACQRLRAHALPARSLSITFDDGYADNHDVALPILLRHGLNATFFVATGFLNGGRMWNDTLIEAVRCASVDAIELENDLRNLARLPVLTLAEKRAAIDILIKACRYLEPEHRERAVSAVVRAARANLPQPAMMTGEQVTSLYRQGMHIGGHTVSHPILTRLPLVDAGREIADGRAHLQDLIQSAVPTFAYPNGRPGEDYSPAHADMVRELGFEAAVTTAWGVSNYTSDPFQLPRFTPWDRARLRYGLRMAHNIVARPPVARFV